MPHLRPGSLESYFKADWQFGKAKSHKSRKLHTVYKRSAADDEHDKSYIKPLASEMLSMYPLLRHFAESVLDKFPELNEAIASFRAACDVLDAIMAAKRSRLRSAVDALVAGIERKVQTHMELHVAAYGFQYIKPKHHRMQHIAAQFRRDKRILDAFVIERIHNTLRRLTQNISSTQRYEASLLAGALNAQLMRLKNKEYGDTLLGKIAPHPMSADVKVAERLMYDPKEISAGDLIVAGKSFGKVALCAASVRALFLYVHPCIFLERVSDHAARVRRDVDKANVYLCVRTCLCDKYIYA